jgi:hypothetical protein
MAKHRTHSIEFKRPGEIVGEHVQRHLGSDLGQTFHQEVGRPHPHLQCTEEMFGRLATLAHGLRVLVEAFLDGLQYMLMLPAGDPSLFASGAALFNSATLTGAGPIARRTNPFSSFVSAESVLGLASDVCELRSI